MSTGVFFVTASGQFRTAANTSVAPRHCGRVRASRASFPGPVPTRLRAGGPGEAASRTPGLLAATRTGLPPAGDDELTNSKIHHGLRHGVTSCSAGRTKDQG